MDQAERKEEAELTLRERWAAEALGARFCAFCKKELGPGWWSGTAWYCSPFCSSEYFYRMETLSERS